MCQAPHTIIADAHRQSIDIVVFHPSGHCLASASHDGILKFWCREPPGSKLDNDANKEFQDNPIVAYGPLQVGSTNVIPLTMPNLTTERAGGVQTQPVSSSSAIPFKSGPAGQLMDNLSNSRTKFTLKSNVTGSNMVKKRPRDRE